MLDLESKHADQRAEDADDRESHNEIAEVHEALAVAGGAPALRDELLPVCVRLRPGIVALLGVIQGRVRDL